MPAVQSMRDVIERDKNGEFKRWEDLDDTVWGVLCDIVDFDTPDSIVTYPEPVWVYFTTRYLEWGVGNGGFAQAAMNIPDWFELAAKGNEILGKPQLAALIRSVAEFSISERKQIDTARQGGLESAFEYFREGAFDQFDEQLDEIGWWCDEERVEYVRAHRDQFACLQP